MKITTYYQKPANVWHKRTKSVSFYEKEFWQHLYHSQYARFRYYKGRIECLYDDMFSN